MDLSRNGHWPCVINEQLMLTLTLHLEILSTILGRSNATSSTGRRTSGSTIYAIRHQQRLGFSHSQTPKTNPVRIMGTSCILKSNSILGVLHAAVQNPNSTIGDPERESIEIRAFVFY